MSTSEFKKELENLINRHSMENGSDTPDWILANYLMWCLNGFNEVLTQREKWYGRTVSGKSEAPPPRPTIAELKAILDSGEKPAINILPNGEVRVDENLSVKKSWDGV